MSDRTSKSVSVELREAWDDADHGRCYGFGRCEAAVTAAIAAIERLTAELAQVRENAAKLLNNQSRMLGEAHGERDQVLAALVKLEALTHEPYKNRNFNAESAAAWAEARALVAGVAHEARPGVYKWAWHLREGMISTFTPWLPPGIELVNYHLSLANGIAHIELTLRGVTPKFAAEYGMIPVDRS